MSAADSKVYPVSSPGQAKESTVADPVNGVDASNRSVHNRFAGRGRRFSPRNIDRENKQRPNEKQSQNQKQRNKDKNKQGQRQRGSQKQRSRNGSERGGSSSRSTRALGPSPENIQDLGALLAVEAYAQNNRPSPHRPLGRSLSWNSSSVQRQRYTPRLRFDKEKFVNSSYHFVLSPSPDEPVDMSDPDAVMDWNRVEAVIYLSETLRNCPICLEQPIAPQMTKCGHIFCAVCVSRYIHISQEQHAQNGSARSWARCPLCFEPVYETALKSLVYRELMRPREETDTKLVLVRRNRSSVVPVRIDADFQYVTAIDEMISHGTPVETPFPCAIFSRLTIARDITAILEREIREILDLLESISDTETAKYGRMCLERLQRRIELWVASHMQPQANVPTQQNVESPHVKDAWTESTSSSRGARDHPAQDAMGLDQIAPSEESSGSGHACSGGKQGKTKKRTKTKLKQGKLNPNAREFIPGVPSSSVGLKGNKDDALFYQNPEGQLIFLHPINYRALVRVAESKLSSTVEMRQGAADSHTSPVGQASASMNSEHKVMDLLSHLPVQVEGKVLAIVHYMQNDESRRSFRFLRHIPESAIFSFILLDLSHIFTTNLYPQIEKEMRSEISKFLHRRSQAAKARDKANARLAKRAQKHADFLEQYARTHEHDYTLDGDLELNLAFSLEPDSDGKSQFPELAPHPLGYAQRQIKSSSTNPHESNFGIANQSKWSKVASSETFQTWVSLTDAMGVEKAHVAPSCSSSCSPTPVSNPASPTSVTTITGSDNNASSDGRGHESRAPAAAPRLTTACAETAWGPGGLKQKAGGDWGQTDSIVTANRAGRKGKGQRKGERILFSNSGGRRRG